MSRRPNILFVFNCALIAYFDEQLGRLLDADGVRNVL